jgi:hypothetical protein
MKPEGWTREKGRSDRFKWCCPETHYEGIKRICHCSNPCTPNIYGRTVYTHSKQNFRLYPGIIRGTEEWATEYKIRGVVEQNIQYFKAPMACGNPKTRDRLTIKADMFLAGITQLLTVILADKISKPQYLRSLKSLIS